MRINTSFSDFKRNHLQKKHQFLFKTFNCKNYNKVENLYKFLLAEKNSFGWQHKPYKECFDSGTSNPTLGSSPCNT